AVVDRGRRCRAPLGPAGRAAAGRPRSGWRRRRGRVGVVVVSEDFVVVAETKRFLGREFLTWLVHYIEEGGGRIARPEGSIELHLGDRVTLEGPVKGERLTLAGPGDLRAELGAGLRRGKLLDRAHLIIKRGE